MKALLFGLMQGLTEFLPISSSGHLSILNRLMHLDKNIFPFIVLLHVATLLAIVIFFWKDIVAILFQKKMILHIFIITIITGIIGLGIERILKESMENRYVVSLCLLLNALILLGLKNLKTSRTRNNITIKDSITVGVAQAIAVFPGISRSGITISTLLRRGFERKEAFALSFLIAIPAIFGAFMIEFKEIVSMKFSILHISLGFFAALISGLIALFIVKKTLLNQKFKNFGYYCLIISILSLIIK